MTKRRVLGSSVDFARLFIRKCKHSLRFVVKLYKCLVHVDKYLITLKI
jgi:hypothetical protein